MGRSTNFAGIIPGSKYLVVIAGPTAVGKTALAIQLAKLYGTEIISADSRQVYKGLTIGTAKPTREQLLEVRHHFINTQPVDELYGAGHFEKDVNPKLDSLFAMHDLVIMVGGSGLYIDAVLHGVDDFTEVPSAIRTGLNLEFKNKGLPWLQAEVQRIDPSYFSVADVFNPQRLIRALEVFLHTGSPYSSFLKKEKTTRPFIPIKILVNMEREKLYGQINKRVDEMMQNGLLEEAILFKDQKHLNALKTVGYKELYEHLEGKITLQEAVEKIKQHTRNYAKRQLTWFKNKDIFEEFTPHDFDRIKNYIDLTVANG